MKWLLMHSVKENNQYNIKTSITVENFPRSFNQNVQATSQLYKIKRNQ